MKDRISLHTCHIPVMGTGYTIDTPLKVAHYGINSVISIIDHRLTEQMREYHSKLNRLTFIPIHEYEEDSRARRITAYLNMVDELVKKKFDKLREGLFNPGTELTKYFEMLPESSDMKMEYNEMLRDGETGSAKVKEQLKERMVPGEIQVNIMTKLDKANYSTDNQVLPAEYNDAHAALRGFANSHLNSSLVLSAGLNPRLFGYMSTFDDFKPDNKGYLKKKIILKVSDYRSALIQGKFLAKKGLWVSEFRIESGLNCGGHAFATDGYLLGPILEEFNKNRTQLKSLLHGILSESLKDKLNSPAMDTLDFRLSVQGGVGTNEEHQFLIDNYNMDLVGWGSPFLLVPDVVNIDKETMELLARTDENGYFLSNASPLGVPFNVVKGSSAEVEKQARAQKGKPGAPCVKNYLAFNTDFTESPICMASSQYQRQKIKELENENLSFKEYESSYKRIIEKECLCVGLGNSLLKKNKIETNKGIRGVTICPGPNMAYFSKVINLPGMMDHIYGRVSVLSRTDRPHMFIKELKVYIDYFKAKLDELSGQLSEAQVKYFMTFQSNLNAGILYYKKLFSSIASSLQDLPSNTFKELDILEEELELVKNNRLLVGVYESV